MSDERLKIAVFIDFDNIEIGVKTTLGQHFDVGAVLEAIKERGEIVTKIAYGDWTRAGDYGRAMSQHAIHMVQRNLTPGGDKNGADINLALDALEMAFTHNHINTFVIVGGDSDFISLVEKLKQYDRKVYVVGGRAFTSVVMQKNCTEFLAYENLLGRGRAAPRGRAAGSDLSQAMPLVRRALKLLADREVLPQLGLLKSTLLQLDSAFSERDYGASSFRDFVQKLANAGHVTVKGTDRSFHVELREAGEGPTPASPVVPLPGGNGEATSAAGAHGAPADEPAGEGSRSTQADALRLFQLAFAQPKTTPRWPMYVRQIKQLVKAVEPQFDERAYGFGGIIEALRYCQREGLFRLERDRQGVVRVFPGPSMQRTPAEGTGPADVAGGDVPTPEALPPPGYALDLQGPAGPGDPSRAHADRLGDTALPGLPPDASLTGDIAHGAANEALEGRSSPNPSSGSEDVVEASEGKAADPTTKRRRRTAGSGVRARKPAATPRKRTSAAGRERPANVKPS